MGRCYVINEYVLRHPYVGTVSSMQRLPFAQSAVTDSHLDYFGVLWHYCAQTLMSKRPSVIACEVSLQHDDTNFRRKDCHNPAISHGS